MNAFVAGLMAVALFSSPEIRTTIEKLGSPKFGEREAAMKKLAEIGPIAIPQRIDVVELHRDPEVRRRAQHLLNRLTSFSSHDARTYFGHTGCSNTVSFAPDGKSIASGGEDGTIRVWDVATQAQKLTLRAHGGRINSVQYSHNGEFLLSAGYKDGQVILWNPATGQQSKSFAGVAVAFSPDGKRLLSGSHDYSVRLWDLGTGKELHNFARHTGIVTECAFTPAGRFAASASWDGSVRIWDTRTGLEKCCFAGHTGEVMSVTVSRDGKFVLSGNKGADVRLWPMPK